MFFTFSLGVFDFLYVGITSQHVLFFSLSLSSLLAIYIVDRLSCSHALAILDLASRAHGLRLIVTSWTRLDRLDSRLLPESLFEGSLKLRVEIYWSYRPER